MGAKNIYFFLFLGHSNFFKKIQKIRWGPNGNVTSLGKRSYIPSAYHEGISHPITALSLFTADVSFILIPQLYIYVRSDLLLLHLFGIVSSRTDG